LKALAQKGAAKLSTRKQTSQAYFSVQNYVVVFISHIVRGSTNYFTFLLFTSTAICT